MTDSITRSTVTATAETIDLDVRSLRITLDEHATPYAQAELVCELSPDAETLDPRDDIRVTIDLHQEWEQPTHADQDRSFDLMITARRIDRVESTITFKLASDEAKLLLVGNAGPLSDFFYSTAQPYMLRAFIQAVFDTQTSIGSLEPGAADADVTLVSPSTNLMVNGNMRTSRGDWGNGGVTGSAARVTGLVGGPVTGVTTFLRCAFTANSGNGLGGPRSGDPTSVETIPVSEGESYVVGVWLRANVAKKVRLGIQWYNGAGVAIGAVAYQPTLTEPTLVANVWTEILRTFTAPALATNARIVIGPSSAVQWVNTNNFDALGVSFEPVNDFHATGQGFAPHHFDGAMAADTYYTYGWNGAADLSSSYRTPLSARNADSLLVQAGGYYWDLIAPVVAAEGLRLFCDEARKWWLVDPATYALPGTVTIDDDHAFTADDEIDLETGDWADSIAAVYRWIDSDGIQQEQVAIATAGSADTRMLRYEFTTAPSGYGAAEAILDRAQLRGRVLEHVALLDLDANPTMEIISDISEAPAELTDIITSVEFTWSEDDEGTRMVTRGGAV